MHGDVFFFIFLIVLVGTAGRLANNWIRAKHGFEPESKWNRKLSRQSGLIDSGETQRLKAENRELHGRLDTMQDRLIALEKIVTDRGYTLANEIEALRDAPLAPEAKERV